MANPAFLLWTRCWLLACYSIVFGSNVSLTHTNPNTSVRISRACNSSMERACRRLSDAPGEHHSPKHARRRASDPHTGRVPRHHVTRAPRYPHCCTPHYLAQHTVHLDRAANITGLQSHRGKALNGRQCVVKGFDTAGIAHERRGQPQQPYLASVRPQWAAAWPLVTRSRTLHSA